MNEHERNKPADEPMYSPDYYDAAYYGKGGRGGFPAYDFNSDEQKRQLALKWHFASHVPHQSALFVGCALGFEVAHWIQNGKTAAGVDVSRYAIAHQIPEARGNCSLYDGRALPVPAESFDLVASFDVLPHLPDEMLAALVAEIVRVAKAGIVWRGVVKNWHNLADEIDGQDGAWVKYRRWETWDELFSKSGKFRLDWMKMHGQYEVTAIYRRS